MYPAVVVPVAGLSRPPLLLLRIVRLVDDSGASLLDASVLMPVGRFSGGSFLLQIRIGDMRLRLDDAGLLLVMPVISWRHNANFNITSMIAASNSVRIVLVRIITAVPHITLNGVTSESRLVVQLMLEVTRPTYLRIIGIRLWPYSRMSRPRVLYVFKRDVGAVMGGSRLGQI